MPNLTTVESKGLIWTTDKPVMPAGKPYCVSIKMLFNVKLYADPSAAPHLYAETPDELLGTPDKRKAIISVVPDDCNTLVASHMPTSGLTYHHKIRLVSTGDLLHWFPDLKHAKNKTLREVYQAQKERFADRWSALALDTRNSKQGPDAIICFNRRGNEFWSRDTAAVLDADRMQAKVPQKFSVKRLVQRFFVR